VIASAEKSCLPRRTEAGLTVISLLVILVIIGFVGLLVMRLVPVYMESFEVGGIVSGLQDDTALHGATHAQLRQALNRRFDVNNIRSIDRDDVRFERERGGTRVIVEYEARVPLVGNLDGVASFRKETLVPQ